MTTFPLNPDPINRPSPPAAAAASPRQAHPFKVLACVAGAGPATHPAPVTCAARLVTRCPAAAAVVGSAPHLHLVTAVPALAPPTTAQQPCFPLGPPLSTPATLASLSIRFERLRAEAVAAAHEALAAAQRDASGAGVLPPVTAHTIPSAGGAGGVAAALSAFAAHGRFDVVVLGRRGLSPAARALGPLVGLGSVSDAVLHAAPVRAVAVAGRPRPVGAFAPTTVAVAVDGSPGADAALAWAVEHALGPADRLALLCAARGPPLPVGPADAGGAAHEALAWAGEKDDAVAAAEEIAASAAVRAEGLGVRPDRISQRVLVPQGGGASFVGAAVVAGAADAGGPAAPTATLVLGSRGLGAVKRFGLGLVGLGSCSAYAAHHALGLDVVVVKSHECGQ